MYAIFDQIVNSISVELVNLSLADPGLRIIPLTIHERKLDISQNYPFNALLFTDTIMLVSTLILTFSEPEKKL